jgi:hypothetical protein
VGRRRHLGAGLDRAAGPADAEQDLDRHRRVNSTLVHAERAPGPRGAGGEDSVWHATIDLFLLNGGNAYDALACLFGVRNHFGFRPPG